MTTTQLKQSPQNGRYLLRIFALARVLFDAYKAMLVFLWC